MFNRITLHNFTRPLHKRKESRKHVGPYIWDVPSLNSKAEGRGFYFNSRGDEMGGSTFRLRLAPADEYMPRYSRLRGTAYHADEYGESTILPYVAILPHGRGFLAAYGEGPGMWGSVDYGIHATAHDAALAAHDAAERCAEREREYQAAESARLADEEGEEENAERI
jgi:hypothetical protein